MQIDFDKINNVVVECVDRYDWPDFCDAYIESCDIDGVPATEEQLDAINENGSFVNEQAAEEFMNYGI
tara:strand:- start:577 stop:780 length:204 start_codon:yes stop_codon:yes gene_type:complete